MEPRQAILVVSFGTSYNDSREKTIGAVERAVAEAFPAYEVRRAFTSQRIIDKLKKRDQRSIDNLKEALDRAAADGIKSLIVQPTHLMDGFEYMDVKAEVEANQGRFERLALGAPLLASEAQRIQTGDAPDGNGRALDDVCRGSALYGCVRGEADRHLFDSCKADQSEGRDPDRVKAVSGENCPVVLCEKTGKK